MFGVPTISHALDTAILKQEISHLRGEVRTLTDELNKFREQVEIYVGKQAARDLANGNYLEIPFSSAEKKAEWLENALKKTLEIQAATASAA